MMELSRKISRIFDRIVDTGAALAGVLLIAVMLAVSVKVFFRYVLQEGLVGIDQLSGASLLFITFLGAAWVLRRGGHVVIDILFVRFKPEIQRRLSIINSIIGAIICLALTWYGTLVCLDSWQRGIMVTREVELPRAIFMSIIPLGSLLLFLQFLRRAWSYRRGKELEKETITT